jgi:hypothetical protein
MLMIAPCIKIRNVKSVNLSRQRLGQALGVSEGETHRMSIKSVYEFGQVVSTAYREILLVIR